MGACYCNSPEVNRYFMTVSEAANLVIQAGTMARGGKFLFWIWAIQLKL